MKRRQPGSRTTLRAWLAAATILVLAAIGSAADPSPKEIRERIDAAPKLAAAGKLEEAVQSLASAIEGLDAMRAMPRVPSGYRLLVEKATAARKALEKAGADVTSLQIPGPPEAGARPVAGRPAPAAGPAVAGLSFSKQIAPLLVKSCGGCHVTGRKGDFQMASYAGLMQSGMVQKGVGNASRLVEVILSGDMPRGGGKVSADDVGLLVKWIDAGAPCDVDPAAALDAVARGGAVAAAPAPAAPLPARPVTLKPGEISFASEVVPVLVEQCLGCHGPQDPENNLSMASLQALVKGGRTGPAVVPGRSADSLLVKKLRGVGIEGQRMPLQRPPLSDDRIAMIAKWIDEGARIDVLSPTAAIEAVAAAGRSRSLSDGELSKVRFAAAGKVWRRAIPDEAAVTQERGGLCLLGNLPEARMQQLAETAVELEEGARRELGVAGSLVKGGVVLYVFRNSFDYSALWQTLLGQERPKGLAGHAGVAGDVAYGALLVPSADEAGDDTRLLLTEQMTAAALIGRGAPAWFAQGAGRAVAMRVVPKAPLAVAWKRDAGGAVRQLGSAQDFLGGHSDPAATAAAAGGFVSTIAGSGKLARLVETLDGGMPFDEAFTAVFRDSPAQAFAAWAARNAGR